MYIATTDEPSGIPRGRGNTETVIFSLSRGHRAGCIWTRSNVIAGIAGRTSPRKRGIREKERGEESRREWSGDKARTEEFGATASSDRRGRRRQSCRNLRTDRRLVRNRAASRQDAIWIFGVRETPADKR